MQPSTEEVSCASKAAHTLSTPPRCAVSAVITVLPLWKYIKGNKVVKVVALKNSETPQVFSKVTSQLLPKMAGKSLSKASAVDGITGATYSSRAVKANVAAAVAYYKKHK